MQFRLTGNASPLNVTAQMFVLIFNKCVRKDSEKNQLFKPTTGKEENWI